MESENSDELVTLKIPRGLRKRLKTSASSKGIGLTEYAVAILDTAPEEKQGTGTATGIASVEFRTKPDKSLSYNLHVIRAARKSLEALKALGGVITELKQASGGSIVIEDPKFKQFVRNTAAEIEDILGPLGRNEAQGAPRKKAAGAAGNRNRKAAPGGIA